MKILVCGGRDFRDYRELFSILCDYVGPELEIVHGDARGADTGADVFARVYGIKVTPFPAKWDRYGTAAGVIRNKAMLSYGIDLVIAFPGGRGTANMVKQAEKRGIPIKIVTLS